MDAKSLNSEIFPSTEPNSNKVIYDWLKNRQELIVIFYRLCEMKPQSYTSHTEGRLTEFCEILIDYVSKGHFDVFEKIASSSKIAPLSPELMVKILGTTNKALDFSDKYNQSRDYTQLATDLSNLGVLLSHRFDWEDQLIDIYIKAVNNERSIKDSA